MTDNTLQPQRRALIVVAKQPAPGQTKTRLCPPLTGEQAAALYECFLRDTLDIVRGICAQIEIAPMIAYLPQGSEAYFTRLAPDFGLLLQTGADLSERLHHATTHCLTHGFEEVVIMDSDSPTLPASALAAAFAALAGADIALGPCDDGGYYCIGLKQPAPSLFLNVTMSTDHVTADTLKEAEQARLSVELLPPCYDIDYASDLKRLTHELDSLPDQVASHTRAFLREHLSVLSL